jgi:hypothetical protein
MIRTHVSRLVRSIATGAFALALAFGIVLAEATPALAIDTTHQATSDGLVTLDMQTVSAQDGFLKITVTLDCTGVSSTGENLDFEVTGFNYVYDDSHPTTVKVDGETATVGLVPQSGQTGNAYTAELSRSRSAGHTLTFTFWGRGNHTPGQPLTSAGSRKTCTATLDVPGGSTPHSQCSLDAVFPGILKTQWEDSSNACALRPSTTDYLGKVSLYVGSERYAGAGSTELRITENVRDNRYQVEVPDDFPTLIVPSGTSLTFVQDAITSYTTSPASRTVDAIEGSRMFTNTCTATLVTTGKLTVTLADKATGAALPGATFQLRSDSSSQTYTTDANGQFVVDPADATIASLLPGSGETRSLVLKETTQPTGYKLDTTDHTVKVARTDTHTSSTTTHAYTFTVDGTQTQTLALTNEAYPPSTVSTGKLTVTLEDATTHAALPNAIYEVRDGETVIRNYETDSQGKFVIDPTDANLIGHLPADGETRSLVLKETTQPAGYQLDATEHRLTISRSDSHDASTNKTTRTYTFTIDGGQVAQTATLTNSVLPEQVVTTGTLTVRLVDSSTGAGLAGATYELRDASGEPIATFTTGANGTFVIDPTADPELAARLAESASGSTGVSTLSLETLESWAHDFTLVETAAPAGHVLDSSAHAIRVSFTRTHDTNTNVTTRSYAFAIDDVRTESVAFENQPIPAQPTNPGTTTPAGTSGSQGSKTPVKPMPAKPRPVSYVVMPRMGDAASAGSLAVLAMLGAGAIFASRHIRKQEA